MYTCTAMSFGVFILPSVTKMYKLHEYQDPKDEFNT